MLSTPERSRTVPDFAFLILYVEPESTDIVGVAEETIVSKDRMNACSFIGEHHLCHRGLHHDDDGLFGRHSRRFDFTPNTDRNE